MWIPTGSCRRASCARCRSRVSKRTCSRTIAPPVIPVRRARFGAGPPRTALRLRLVARLARAVRFGSASSAIVLGSSLAPRVPASCFAARLGVVGCDGRRPGWHPRSPGVSVGAVLAAPPALPGSRGHDHALLGVSVFRGSSTVLAPSRSHLRISLSDLLTRRADR